MPINFRTLKQDVATGYRPNAFTSSTVPTQGGTTTTLVDSARQEAAGTWDRVTSWVKFGTGNPGLASVNDGVVRMVTGFSTNFSVTFAPALTASVPSGSTYALFQDFHPDNDIGLAINTTLRDNFPGRVVFSVVTLNEQDDVRAYSIPSAVANQNAKLVKIERSVGTVSSSYQFRELRDGFDYTVVDYAGTAQLQIQYLPVPSTVLRLTGERPASDLSADTDTTDEPEHLILMGSRMFLALQEGDKERASFWGARYESAKRDYAKSRPALPLRRPHFLVQ